MTDWKKELTKKHNEEHPPPTTDVVSLINIAKDDVDQNAFKVRIPYEDLDHLQCATVDILLLLASGIKPKEVSQIVSKRYGSQYNVRKVYDAKSAHPAEFCKMLTFYREIFLNQQVQSIEQMFIQKVYDALPDMEVSSPADVLKSMQALKMASEIRKTKEEDGQYQKAGAEEMKRLEDKMRAITGGKQ